MKTINALDVKHPLFKTLSTKPPTWWKNLTADDDLYIDIRKGNTITVYYNGGSIMQMSWDGGIKAQVHIEYVPLKKITKDGYVSYTNCGANIDIQPLVIMPLNNFDGLALKSIKARIERSFSKSSEKGIQASFVTLNNKKSGGGFFIDTEFQYDTGGRIDMVWVDIKTKKIFFVELKTIDDPRLCLHFPDSKSIDVQLSKYTSYIKANAREIKKYYTKIFEIKKNLGILPRFVSIASIEDFQIEEKPILLVGNCTNNWINAKAKIINSFLDKIAYGCFYQGINTKNFSATHKGCGNKFIF